MLLAPLHSSDFEIKCPLSNSNAVSGSCDHNGGILTSKYGDIKITVPVGAIKDRDLAKFYIATDLYGPYALPSQRINNLVSPYYWVGVTGSYHFQKPAQVEFEHFGACDPSHYQLLCCEDDDESYTMRPVDYELSFTVQDDISWCTFNTYKFCSYCLFGHQDQIPKNRIDAFYLKPENFHHLNQFRVEIWLSFPVKLCLKRNEELYRKRGLVLDSSFSFEASCDKSSASFLTVDYSENIKYWTMKHTLTKKIYTEKVNFYNHYTKMEELEAKEECQLFPPRFILNIVKDPECTTFLNADITVTMYNIEEKKDDTCIFNLFVPVPLKKISPVVETRPSKCASSMTIAIPPHCCSKSVPKLRDLVLYSSDISYCWQDVALQLEIPNAKICQIIADNRNDTNSQCRTMFSVWQDRASSPLCWCHFIQALCRLELNEVAQRAQKHLHLSPPNKDEQYKASESEGSKRAENCIIS